jgi:peptidoglycan/LPS O-acetylase OafA/YrhL
LRPVAALLVITAHISTAGLFADPAANQDLVHYFLRVGFPAVGYFFMLSGFVLTWSASPRDTRALFWRRRAVRIYPNHVITWGLMILFLVWTGQSVTGSQAGTSLLLVHSWIPKLQYFGIVNGPSWSLCCELLFYAAFPLVLPLIRKIPVRLLWPTLAGTIGLIMVVPALSRLLPDQPLMPGFSITTWQFWFVYYFPPVRMLEFLVGILVCRLIQEGRWPRIGLLPAVGLSAVGYVVLVQVPVLYAMAAVGVIPMAVLMAEAALSDIRGTRSPLRAPVMVLLGDLTFGFYLAQNVVISWGHYALGNTRVWSTGAAAGISALFLVGSLVCAWLLYTFVERPAMRRWSRPRRRPSGPASLPARTATEPLLVDGASVE